MRGAGVGECFFALLLFMLPFSPPPAGVADGQTLRVPVGHSEAYIIIKVRQCAQKLMTQVMSCRYH